MILLIGGPAGAGKSTLSLDISKRLDTIHRIGTGFIREIVRTTTSAVTDPALFGFTFSPSPAGNCWDRLVQQSIRLRPAIYACIERAYCEGTDLIIEGPHLVPGLITHEFVSLFVLLVVPDPDAHNEMMHAPTHAKRVVSAADFAINRALQQWLIERANVAKIEVVPNVDRDATCSLVVSRLLFQ
jgi:2-phosphoglycerate kinase